MVSMSNNIPKPKSADLSHADVRAVSVDVGVVGEQDVHGRPRFLGNHVAAVAILNDMHDVAVLADDAETQRLNESTGQPSLLRCAILTVTDLADEQVRAVRVDLVGVDALQLEPIQHGVSTLQECVQHAGH